MIGGRDLSPNCARLAGVQQNRVVIRTHDFVGMHELQLTRLRSSLRVVHFGHQGDVAKIPHPNGRLMRANEAGDRRILIGVGGHADAIVPVCAVQLVMPKGVVTSGIVPP